MSDRFYWAGAATDLNRIAVTLCGPVAAGSVAWSFATRRTLALQIAPASRALNLAVRQVVSTAAIISIPWYVLVVTVTVGLGTIELSRYAALILLGAASVVAWSAVGLIFGSVLQRAPAAASAILTSYVWIGWMATTNSSIRHLSFQLVASPQIFEQLPGALVRALWILVIALTGLGLAASIWRWNRGVGIAGLVCGILALAVAVGTVRSVGVVSTEARQLADPSEVACTSVDGTRVCVWNEDRGRLTDVTPMLARMLGVLRDTQYGAPAILTEPNIPLNLTGVEPSSGRVDQRLSVGARGYGVGDALGEFLLPDYPPCGQFHSPNYPTSVFASYPGLQVRDLMVAWLAQQSGGRSARSSTDPDRLSGVDALEQAPIERQRAWFDANIKAQLDCAQQPVSIEQV